MRVGWLDYQQQVQHISVNASPTAKEKKGVVEDACRHLFRRCVTLGLTLGTSFMSVEGEHYH